MSSMLGWLNSTRGDRAKRAEVITIVSGLPRSGTSMMMKMLQAGGLAVLTDGARAADSDNPRGYYEFERVKKLREGDVGWLAQAGGKVVKVISELLRWLPPEYAYRVIFMRRAMSEILASQKTMLMRRGADPGPTDEKMAALYAGHLQDVERWLEGQPHMDVLYVSHHDVLADPTTQCRRINTFLGGSLDEWKMAGIVEPSLYRQRGPTQGPA